MLLEGGRLRAVSMALGDKLVGDTTAQGVKSVNF